MSNWELPEYTKDADPFRLVRILCRGEKACGGDNGVFAELNEGPKNGAALKDAPHGVYTAKCLRCGHVATDNYNWASVGVPYNTTLKSAAQKSRPPTQLTRR